MNRIAGILFNVVLPIVVLTISALVVHWLGAKPKPDRPPKPPQLAIPVDVVKAVVHDGELPISTTGVVVPYREVELSAEVGGKVIEKVEHLRPGRFVRAGELLIEIEPSDYELEVQRLEKLVAKATSELESNQVENTNTQMLAGLARKAINLRNRELKRIQSLRETRSTSETALDEAEKNLLEASLQLTTQENRLRALENERKSLAAALSLAEIDLRKAELDASRTRITAPFDGVVISHSVETNSHVQAGQPVAVIEDTSSVEVRCNLRKEDLDFVLSSVESMDTSQPADAYRLPPIKVEIHYSRAGRAHVWQGVLSRQDGLGMDQRTRTMPVRILVDNPLSQPVDTAGGGVRPIALVRGMFVKIQLHCRPEDSLLTIPEKAIRPGKNVWVVQDRKLAIRPVHIVRIIGGLAYLEDRNDSFENAQIISSPVPGAKEGLLVTSAPQGKSGGGAKDGPGKRRAGGDVAEGKPGPGGNRKKGKRTKLIEVAQEEG